MTIRTTQERLYWIEKQLERLRVGAHTLTGGGKPYSTIVIAASNSTAADKLRADYVCDGTADEVEINTAISACTVGGKVLLLEGTFNLSAPVFISVNNFTLQGMGRKGTILIDAVGFTGDALIDIGSEVVSPDFVTVDALFLNVGNRAGIHCAHATNDLTFSDLRIEGGGSTNETAGVVVRISSTVVFNNCSFLTGFGIFFEDESDYVSIVGCEFGCTTCIYIGTLGALYESQIIGNSFWGDYGIVQEENPLWQVPGWPNEHTTFANVHTTIVGNTFGMDQACILLQGVENIIISNNVLYPSAVSGPTYALYASRCRNISFSGNIIFVQLSASYSAVRFDRVDASNISGNEFVQTACEAIYLTTCSAILIQGNHIGNAGSKTNNTYAALRLGNDANGCSIIGNAFQHNQYQSTNKAKYVIWCEAGADTNRFEANNWDNVTWGTADVLDSGANNIFYFNIPRDTGDFHTHDASPLALDDLSDVNAPTPGDGDALIWDDGTNAWISGAPGASFNDTEGDPADVAAAAADGTSVYAARRDHAHTIGAGIVTSTMLADGAALAEILDDDGAGSLLDADLLDGLEAAAFAVSGHTHTLDALSNVNVPTPGDGDVLTYDTGTSNWIAAAPGAAGGQYRQFVYIMNGNDVDILTGGGDALFTLEDLE